MTPDCYIEQPASAVRADHECFVGMVQPRSWALGCLLPAVVVDPYSRKPDKTRYKLTDNSGGLLENKMLSTIAGDTHYLEYVV